MNLDESSKPRSLFDPVVHQAFLPPIPPVPPLSPAPATSPDFERAMTFLSAENERNRNYFSHLFNVTWTVSAAILTVLLISLGFLGFKSFKEVLEQASASAKRSAQDEVTQQLAKIEPDIQKEIRAEFTQPNIEKLVREEAERATETTANQIIREEVAKQVAALVSAEQANIHRSIAPLQALSHEQTLFAMAKQYDGKAFDQLGVIAADANAPETLRRTAQADRKSVIDIMLHVPRRYTCPTTTNDPHSIAVSLRSPNSEVRGAGLACIYLEDLYMPYFNAHPNAATHPPNNRFDALTPKVQSLYPLLEKLVELSRMDSSLEVRVLAFEKFKDLTTYDFSVTARLEPFDYVGIEKWWQLHRGDYMK